MRRKPAQVSFEDMLGKVRDLPAGYKGQILNGEMHIISPPSAARAHTIAEITAMLVAGSPLGDPGPEAWAFESGVEIAPVDESILVVDVAGFRMERADLARAPVPLRMTPAWVCEVLCERTRNFTLTAKRRTYAELGVAHLWIADPEAHVLDVLVNQRGKWLLHTTLSDEPRASAPPFDAVHFDANELWITSSVKLDVLPPPPSSKRRAYDAR